MFTTAPIFRYDFPYIPATLWILPDFWVSFCGEEEVLDRVTRRIA
jgi:hypothetical protein